MTARRCVAARRWSGRGHRAAAVLADERHRVGRGAATRRRRSASRDSSRPDTPLRVRLGQRHLARVRRSGSGRSPDRVRPHRRWDQRHHRDRPGRRWFLRDVHARRATGWRVRHDPRHRRDRQSRRCRIRPRSGRPHGGVRRRDDQRSAARDRRRPRRHLHVRPAEPTGHNGATGGIARPFDCGRYASPMVSRAAAAAWR